MNAKIAELAASLQADENLTSRKQLECPLCGRTCDRLFNMKRHCASHTDGKMAAMLTQLESDAKIVHAVFLESSGLFTITTS